MSFPRRRDDRGAAAVEAALIMPLLVLLVFGIIEISFLVRDNVAVASATRAAGRMASANAGAGPGDRAAATCVAPCAPAHAPRFSQLAANAVQTMGTALPPDAIRELWVYRANNRGFPGAANSTTMQCTTDCVRYTWVASENAFRFAGGAWISSTVSACANQSPDSVGVLIRARHSSVTRLLGDLTIEDHAVFAFEPLPTITCASGAHP